MLQSLRAISKQSNSSQQTKTRKKYTKFVTFPGLKTVLLTRTKKLFFVIEIKYEKQTEILS